MQGDISKKLRIVFMGTPEFAVPSLDALLNAGHEVVGVVTAPDKPAGRGLKLNESAVKQYAVSKRLNILQPEKLKNPEFINQLSTLAPDLQVVVAFRMLPEVVWNLPPMGTINLHASLLPQYRGAAPINWAVINGEKETGITTFKLQHEIDTGNILMQETVLINENETAGELHDKMKLIGAGLVVKTVNGLADGSIHDIPQSSIVANPSMITHAPKIFTETARINWNKSVHEIYNLIRGLSPYPAAFTSLNGKMLKVYKANKEASNVAALPGTVETDKKSFLKFACINGYIKVEELQLEGKKRMAVTEFLKGYR
jgi:methionyl-tRNA formyltransferase